MHYRHEVLFQQLETYRSYILGVVEDVTEVEADMIPNAFNNNIRWNLGHIYTDQYLWIEALTKEKTPLPDEYRSWFGYGTSPNHFSSNTPSMEDLKILLKEQPGKLREIYGDQLELEHPATEMGMNTIEQVLIRTIFHEGMHLQAILDLKKCIKR